MKLTFLGTGTSSGIPLLACTCRVCRSPDPRDRRLRSSVLIEAQGRTLLVDAGPDFREQMLRHDVAHLDAVLITHGHRDHIAGIDDLRAYNFATGRDMDLYADAIGARMIRQQFPYIFETDPYPGVPRLDLHEISHERNIQVAGIPIDPVQIWHGKLPILGFRIGGLAYLTDVKTIDPTERAKLRGIDTLIVSAIRDEPHHAHMNLDQALAFIRDVGPRRAYLMHFSHYIGRHADLVRRLPSSVDAAYDGLTLAVS